MAKGGGIIGLRPNQARNDKVTKAIPSMLIGVSISRQGQMAGRFVCQLVLTSLRRIGKPTSRTDWTKVPQPVYIKHESWMIGYKS